MRQTLYSMYRFAGSMVMRTGANNVLSSGLHTLSDQLDSLIRRLLHPNTSNVCILNGLKITFPPEGYFGIEITSGEYEPKTTRLVQRLLRPGVTFVDVGAHVGYYSLVAATVLQQSGAVYAFEPDPITFSCLKENVTLNGFDTLVRVYPRVISNVTGPIKLFIGRRDRVANSIFASSGVSSHAVTCESTSLDDFFRQENWPSVHLIKIDVEGAEHAVLQGMMELSARNPDLKLILEFFPSNLKAAGVTPEAFFTTLHGLGFAKVAMIFDELEPLMLPRDIPVLIRRCGPAFVNLLCEKE